jgi:nicotinamide phosphoribosyltransferase
MNTKLIAEAVFLQDLITRKFPTGVVSVVCDSFDFWAVLTKILPALKETIMARQASAVAPGKLVIRPDSGDPVEVICGMKPILWGSEKAYEFDNIQHFYDFMDTKIVSEFSEFDCVKIGGKFHSFAVTEKNRIDIGVDEIPYAVVAGSIATLWKTFGGTVTDKGYKLLDSHIGLIYGDSITTKRAEEIMRRLAEKGFASGNVVFGVGSFTYQCVTRDTFGFAVKATYTEVDGEGVVIFKDPKTDSKKKSAKGLLFVGYNTDGGYVLRDDVHIEDEQSEGNHLKEIFRDGEFTRRTSLEDIRIRLSK